MKPKDGRTLKVMYVYGANCANNVYGYFTNTVDVRIFFLISPVNAFGESGAVSYSAAFKLGRFPVPTVRSIGI